MPESTPVPTPMSVRSLLEATSTLDVVFWAIGLAVMAVGLIALGRARRRLASDQPSPPDAPSGHALLATAMALLVAGYHMIVWGLPDHFTNLKAPESSWWLLFLILSGVVLLTRSMDRLDRAGSGTDGEHTGA